MTKTEKETKIADLKRRAENKSLPASAVKKLNEMISELEKEPAEEPAEKAKVEKKEKSIKESYVINVVHPDGFLDSIFNAHGELKKFKNTEAAEKEIKNSEKNLKGYKQSVVPLEKANRKNNFDGKKPDTKKDKPASEKKPTDKNKIYKTDEDCEKVIADLRAKKAKAKKSAAKSENTPVVKKDEKRVEKVVESIKKHYKDGELTKAAIGKLIKEFTEKLEELRELFKTAK